MSDERKKTYVIVEEGCEDCGGGTIYGPYESREAAEKELEEHKKFILHYAYTREIEPVEPYARRIGFNKKTGILGNPPS